MQASIAAFDLIRAFEGLSLKVYADAAGKATIGYGHLVQHGEMPKFETGITQAEAAELLLEDIGRIAKRVDELTSVLKLGLALPQPAFDALVSFAFNVGPEALERSMLLEKVRCRDWQGAADQFLVWDHAAGKVEPGLVKRRAEESKLFLSGFVPGFTAA